MYKKVAEFIFEEVIKNTTDCQYCVDFSEVQDHFQSEELIQQDVDEIIIALYETEKVADVQVYDDMFDVILYTDY